MNGNEFDFFRLSNEQKENYIRDLNDIDVKKKLISDPKLDFANLVLLIKSAKNVSEMQDLTKELNPGQLKQLIVNTQDLSPEEKRFVYCSAPKQARKTVYKMSSSYDKKILKKYEKGYKSQDYEDFKMSYPEKKNEEKKETPKETTKTEPNDKNMEAIKQEVEQKQKQVTVKREKITSNIQNIDRLKNITIKLEKEIAISEKALAGRMKKKDKKALQAKLAGLRQELTNKQAEIGRLAMNNMERSAEIKETEKEIAAVREEMNKQQQAQQQAQQRAQQQAQQRAQQQAQQRAQQQQPRQQTTQQQQSPKQQMPRQKDPRQQTRQEGSKITYISERNNRQRQKRTTEEKVKNFEKNAMEMMQFGVVMMPIYINFNDTKMQGMPTPIATIPTTQMVMYPIFVPHVIAMQQQMMQQMMQQQMMQQQQMMEQSAGYTRARSKGYIGIVAIMVILSIIILMMVLILTITTK